MMLLDRLVSADAESLCAEVHIRPDSLFCAAGGVGGWVGMEYMAQAIGAYAGYTAGLRGEPVKIGFLLGLRRYECSCPVFAVGSVLRIHVQRVYQQSDQEIGLFDCWIDDRDETVATATISVFQPADVKEFLKGSVP
jgi:predicted hotdog family 3-hydroxylacyl-ACP dehydratase